MATKLLISKGLNFDQINVVGDQSLWQEMEQKTGRNTVPKYL